MLQGLLLRRPIEHFIDFFLVILWHTAWKRKEEEGEGLRAILIEEATRAMHTYRILTTTLVCRSSFAYTSCCRPKTKLSVVLTNAKRCPAKVYLLIYLFFFSFEGNRRNIYLHLSAHIYMCVCA